MTMNKNLNEFKAFIEKLLTVLKDTEVIVNNTNKKIKVNIFTYKSIITLNLRFYMTYNEYCTNDKLKKMVNETPYHNDIVSRLFFEIIEYHLSPLFAEKTF